MTQEPNLVQELALLYRVELSGIGYDRFRLIGLEKVVSGKEWQGLNSLGFVGAKDPMKERLFRIT